MTPTTAQPQTRRPEPADPTVAGRPVSPGILAMAILLALTASVASAGVLEGSDPARLDRREAPREMTVRWLAEAVAKAARDLAATESKTTSAAKRVLAPTDLPITGEAPAAPALCQPQHPTPRAIPDGWPQQGLINLPPPAQR